MTDDALPLTPLLLAVRAASDAGSGAAFDEVSFARLVRQHRQQVYRVALSVLGAEHASEAEDVTQDVFVRLFRSWTGLRGDSAISTWLHRTALNRAIDVRRRARFQKPHVQIDETHAGVIAAPDADAEALVQLVDRLPAIERVVVHLHYWMGYPAVEIADLLDIPQATVRSHLFRARRRLQDSLADRTRDE